MRRLLFLCLVILMVVLSVSCDLQDSEPLTTYYTDFTEDEGDFIFNPSDSNTSEIAEIANGTLHLKAITYDYFAAGSQAQFFQEIPRNSTIYFSVKFDDYFNNQHPRGHFDFLHKNSDNRINFMTGTGSFGYYTSVNGSQVNVVLDSSYTFTQDIYYSFKYHLKTDSIDVYIDDVLKWTVDYVDGLPETGYFKFESHNEYWIDEFGFDVD